MPARELLRTALLIAAVGFAAAVLAAPASAATRCPATFQVLGNDHIGAMSLPAGAYDVTVNGISCATASTLFARFLEDYDGHLPSPWVANASKRSFTRGASSTGFSVKLAAYPPPPPPVNPPSRTSPSVCPATFSVLHNDRIGSVAFPQGAYRTSLLSTGVSCQQASQLFATFLDDAGGDLPDGWRVASLSGSARGGVFTNPQGESFQQQFASSSTGGGGISPRGSVACGPFRVLHNDHIGSLYLPAGTYDVYTLDADALSCSQATTQFTRFLDAASLAKPWILDSATGTFTRGAGSTAAFRIKPAASRVVR